MLETPTTAVIPVAGLGTRFLPVTRAVPKALLPVVDTPLIHRAVREAAAAGFQKIVLVISPGMESVAAYFDEQPVLEAALGRSGKTDLLAAQHAVRDLAEVVAVTQDEPKGLGHAVLMARQHVGDAPFAVFLPDELFWGEKTAIQQVKDVWGSTGGNVLGVVEVPDEATPALGIVDGAPVSEAAWKVSGMVEKPPFGTTPSNLAIVGPYILTPAVLDTIASSPPGAIGEVQLTDGIAALIGAEPVHACVLSGARIDAGVPAGMIAATIFEARRNGPLYERACRILADAERARQG